VSSFRWGLVSSLCAIFISVSLGILFGVNPVHILVRALVFGAIFFGFGFGLRFLINSFFPDLLENDDESVAQDPEQGEHKIDITLDSSGEYAVPELYKSSGDPQEMGNIEDLISGVFRPRNSDDDRHVHQMNTTGIDAGFKAGYNGFGGIQDIPNSENDNLQDLSVFDKTPAEKPAAEIPHFTPSFGDTDGLGGLPDLDMMARAFSSFGGDPVAASAASAAVQVPQEAPSPVQPAMAPIEEIEEAPSHYATGNKPQALEGDFDPKSLAQGIRTVLSKD